MSTIFRPDETKIQPKKFHKSVWTGFSCVLKILSLIVKILENLAEIMLKMAELEMYGRTNIQLITKIHINTCVLKGLRFQKNPGDKLFSFADFLEDNGLPSIFFFFLLKLSLLQSAVSVKILDIERLAVIVSSRDACSYPGLNNLARGKFPLILAISFLFLSPPLLHTLMTRPVLRYTGCMSDNRSLL